MLQPSVNFHSVLREARAIILLGGTMQPFSHFSNLLFHALPQGYLREFACGHVVDPENVLAVSLATGPTKRALNFSFRQRSNPYVILICFWSLRGLSCVDFFCVSFLALVPSASASV